MKNNVETKIVALVCEQLKQEFNHNLDLETKLLDLGLDSLDLVELVIKLEDAFKQEVSDQAASCFVKLGDITAYFASAS